VHKILGTILVIWLCGPLAALAADAYTLADGSSVSGDIVTVDNNGVMFRTGPETYSEKISWLKFSQDALKQLSQNAKARPFAEPFIEPAPAQTGPAPVQLADMSEVRLPLAPKRSLIGALFTSSVGLILMLLVYAANIYAGYEIAEYRVRPKGMGMGMAAALPVIGPIILLCMPSQSHLPQEPLSEEAMAAAPAAAEPQRFAMPGTTPPPASVPAPAASMPPQEHIQIVASGFSGAPPPSESNTEVFQRGQFMFNRRFFETKFPGFFSIARPEADRGKILVVKTASALLTVERISRISANEVHFETIQGEQREEIMVPFGDIQQVQLKRKA